MMDEERQNLLPQQDGPPLEETKNELRRYIGIVDKRKWLMLATATIVFALVAVWTLRQPRIYRATATVLVETTSPRVLGQGVSEVVDLGSGSYWWNQQYFNTQKNIVRSRAVAERALRIDPRLADPKFWGLEQGITDAASLEALRVSFSPIELVQGSVLVEEIADAGIISISMEHISPEVTATVANAVATSFVEGNLERKIDVTRGAADWLGDQMSDLRVRLEDSERALQEYKENNDILTTSLEDRQRISSDRLVMLNTELTRVRLRRVELEARLRQARELNERTQGDELGGELTRDFLNSSVINQLKQSYVELKTKRAAMTEQYQDKHPKLVAVARQMEIVQHDLQKEIGRLLRAEESSLQEAKEVETRLREMLASERETAGDINRKEISYNQLAREMSNNERLYELVSHRLKETDLTGVLKTNNLRVLDAARVPHGHIHPSLRKNFSVGLLLALVLSLIAIFGVELLDNTIKTHEDVVQLLGLAFLGVVPSIAEDAKNKRAIRKDLVVLDAPKSSAAECCRSLRTNLLFMSPDQPLKSLVVTSAKPQEGKTTVANALAITMAQAGSRVLIVDTDMRRPRMHRVYGVSNEIGISNVVLGQHTLEEAVKHTEVAGLDLLPCGPVPPNPAELLLSNAFKSLIDEISERYDRVVFDSPPVGAVTDPVLLGALTEGVVLVLKSGSTGKDVAVQAVRAMHDANVRVLGAVVNDLDIQSRKYGYGYSNYYSTYGYYGDRANDDEQEMMKA